VSRPQITRRTFVGAAAGGLGALGLGGPVVDAARRAVSRRRPPIALDGRFRQSVASGQPASDAVTLWTRVEELDRSSRLQVEVARDQDFANVVYRRTVLADAGRDYTVHHRVTDPRALRPGERYYFRFFTCNESSPVGRFRTSLPPDSLEPVRIGFFSCQNYAAGYYTAHAGLLREPDLDLVVCLGDYIYEQTGQDDIPARRDRTGANRDSEVQTLPEYRDKYRLYHSDPNLLALRERYPLLAIWDDHESENDNAGANPSPSPDKQNTSSRRLPYLARRAAAYRAYFEHMPRIQVREEPHRIYGGMRLGGNVDMLLLDQRQYRDQQPCGGRTAEPCPQTETNAPRTLLGHAQKAWFKGALESSRAKWRIVGNQVMIMALDVPARTTINPDQWDGYAAERRELLEFAQARGIADIAFLTGDIHTFFAGNVTPSGREGAPAVDGTPAAVEFVGGAMTSKGLEEEVPDSDGVVGRPLTENGVRANNPHIKFANLVKRGYGVLEARADELRVDFRSADTVDRSSSPVTTLASFRVAKGSPNVEQI
jgi:alkaline phosphatase D